MMLLRVPLVGSRGRTAMDGCGRSVSRVAAAESRVLKLLRLPRPLSDSWDKWAEPGLGEEPQWWSWMQREEARRRAW